jgi:hypothetical protein
MVKFYNLSNASQNTYIVLNPHHQDMASVMHCIILACIVFLDIILGTVCLRRSSLSDYHMAVMNMSLLFTHGEWLQERLRWHGC